MASQVICFVKVPSESPLSPYFPFPSGQTVNFYLLVYFEMINYFHILTVLSTMEEFFLFRGIFALSCKAAGGIACFKYLHIRNTKCFKLMYQLHCFNLHREFRDKALL